MESGLVVKEGTAVAVTNRAVGVKEDYFTRARDFVPERCGMYVPVVAFRKGVCIGGEGTTLV